jgi:hypothetical protein
MLNRVSIQPRLTAPAVRQRAQHKPMRFAGDEYMEMVKLAAAVNFLAVGINGGVRLIKSWFKKRREKKQAAAQEQIPVFKPRKPIIKPYRPSFDIQELYDSKDKKKRGPK